MKALSLSLSLSLSNTTTAEKKKKKKKTKKKEEEEKSFFVEMTVVCLGGCCVPLESVVPFLFLSAFKWGKRFVHWAWEKCPWLERVPVVGEWVVPPMERAKRMKRRRGRRENDEETKEEEEKEKTK